MKHAVTICLLNFLLTMALVSQIPTEGMAGYWSFTGNADDQSGNGNHGTVHGAALTEDRFGNPNSAYLFDGTNDRIYIGNNLLMQGDSISFSCWFKSEIKGALISTGNRNTYLILKSYSDSLRSQLYLSDATDGHGSYVGNSYASPEDWHHVAVTYDGQNHSFYLDGDIVDQTTNNGDVFSNQTVYLNFGVYQYGGSSFNHWYEGILDDVRFYNSVLGPDDVHNLYSENLCSDTVINDTVTYYVSSLEFESIAPKTIFDSTQLLTQTNGICDSVINHYTKFVYEPAYCFDTITTEVFDTTFITVIDSISVTDTLIINAVLTGIDPPDNINTLKIYPNPAKDHLYIETGDYTKMVGYRLKIINLSGEVVFETLVEEPVYELNLSGWTGYGLYFIQVIDSGETITEIRKLILE